MTDNHEFCYILLERMTSIMCDAQVFLADSLEIKCTSVPQFQTYDSRTQTSTMNLGFASYSSTLTSGGQNWAVLELAAGVTGGVRMPFDVLRNKIWTIEVDYVTERAQGLLSPDSVINDYVLQIGVYI
ncbi:g7772 [Coccomyxa elongata]